MTNLNINNEYDELKSVLVCFGENVPLYDDYKTDDPEFTKFHHYAWDKNLLLQQQAKFFELLNKYGVELIFPKKSPNLPWQQMYTRDTAFVIGENLYYSNIRKMISRNGEVEHILNALNISAEHTILLDAEIEGGDVIVESENQIYIGHSSRTSIEAINQLNKIINAKVFELGEYVMHLDTRLTLISQNTVLLNPGAFSEKHLNYIRQKYKVIEIYDDETKKLGTNVFVINPETVVVPTQHKRIGIEIENEGFKVEYIDYTEPINLGGSFRCTTMPLSRIS